MSNDVHTKAFIKDLKKSCKEHNVDLRLEYYPKIRYAKNMYVSGYFQDEPAELVTAIKMAEDKWLPILVHESCHMDQWLENTNIWQLQNSKYGDINSILDNRLKGDKNCTVKQFKEALKKCLRLELDCEKRSVKKIKKYNLPIDVKDYIKKANAYIFLYSIMESTYKWCDTSPYKINEIYKIMPDKFLRVKDYIHDKKMLDLYKIYCYK
jgi:hypothetical protein